MTQDATRWNPARATSILAGCPAWWSPASVPDQVSLKNAAHRAIVARWIKGELPGDFPGLLYYGSAGRGKTSAAIECAWAVGEAGKHARFETLSGALTHIKDTWGQKGASTEAALEWYLRPLALVLDDIGMRAYTPEERDLIYQIVVGRHNLKRITLLTTNLDLSTVAGVQAFGDGRIVDRFRNWLVKADTWGKTLRGGDR